MIAPFTASGAKRLRGVLELLNGNFEGAEKVGTVHDMRFVFLDDDRNLLFTTAYDGDWDPYMTTLPRRSRISWTSCSSCFEGWPGIRSPEVKDFIASHQVPASAWYVATRGSPSRKLGGWRRRARRWTISWTGSADHRSHRWITLARSGALRQPSSAVTT